MTLDRTPTKIVCVGKNYALHAQELGTDVPSEPIIFLKPISSLLAPGAAIRMPQWAGRIDFEGEIGLVVGKRARRVSRDDAWDIVEAIVPVNDVTARDLQRRDGQWTRAKSFDTFCPVGKPIPVADVDLGQMEVITRVNGRVRQQAHVDTMVFPIPELIRFISAVMTLEPGDLIATGTPDGIGPLSPGDEVVVEIPGVGLVANPVTMEEADSSG
jgi:2-keto-4-pentenoate hydratase/2-oxohepta-3-ene-1,7-dioic acid hydratase in catechol pathway